MTPPKPSPAASDYPDYTCLACDGDGEWVSHSSDNGYSYIDRNTCRHCNGRGRVTIAVKIAQLEARCKEDRKEIRHLKGKL